MECLTAELAIKNSDRVEIFYHRDPASIWHTYSTSQAIDPPSTFATASLVFHHSKNNFDRYPALAPNLSPILPHHLAPPEALGQPVTASPREEDSVSATLDQLSNQTDALMTIPPGKVASCREVFGNVADKKGSPHSPPRNPRNILSTGGSPIKWPTHDSVSNRSLSSPSRVGASAMATTTASSERRQASDLGSQSEVAKDSAKLYPFSTASFNDDLGKHSIKTTCSATDIMAIKTCEDMFVPLTETSEIIAAATVQTQSPQKLSDPSTPLPPPQSPPPSSRTPPPPPPPRSPSPPPSSSPPPPRSRQALVVRGLTQKPESPPAPSSDQTSPPLNSSSSDQLKPRQREKLGATSSLQNPPKTADKDSSPQNQNPLNFSLDPTIIKIYSALTCGLACGALVAVAVPSAPITVPAVIIGAGAGAVAGWSIASRSSNRVTKQNEP